MADAVDSTRASTRSRAGDKWHSAEYKREQRRRKAEREGRLFRPGRPGRLPGPNAGKVATEKAARSAWREWISHRAPAWWLEAYNAYTGRVQAEAARERDRRRDKTVARRTRKHAKKAVAYEQQAASADGTIPLRVWPRLLRSATACAYCERDLTQAEASRQSPTDATIDHIVPLSRGGKHGLSNVSIVCRACNSAKGNLTLAEWTVAKSGHSAHLQPHDP